MACEIIRKINIRLKFLHRKDQYLNYKLRRLLCNALIQPSFDYVCSSWYANLTKRLKLRLQATQNKCIRFCLRLGNRTHLGYSDFKKINWLPVEDRVFQCISAYAFKFFIKKCPAYVNDLFLPINSTIITRQNDMGLYQPYRRTEVGKNTLSYMGPRIWNKLPMQVRQCKVLNTFKHKVKDYFFDQLRQKENNQFIYYC